MYYMGKYEDICGFRKTTKKLKGSVVADTEILRDKMLSGKLLGKNWQYRWKA